MVVTKGTVRTSNLLFADTDGFLFSSFIFSSSIFPAHT